MATRTASAKKKKAAPAKKKAAPAKKAAAPAKKVKAAKPDLKTVFAALKKQLAVTVPPLTVTKDLPGNFEVTSLKPSTFMGRSYPHMYFGAAVIKSDYVGLYMMYLYADKGQVSKLSPALRKCLKGMSCLHIKTDDPALMKDVSAAIKLGIACYKKLGFI